jgi:hypothetical protein
MQRSFPLLTLAALFAWQALAAETDLPLVYQDDFEKGADRWEPTEPKVWKIAEADGKRFYSQFEKGKYSPPYRSPFNIAILKETSVTDFVLTARVRSTVKDYDHRDMCLVFGYQDPSHFYYVHLGKKTDDHANQIFIVNSAPRIKISTKTTPGTNWDDNWHDVKIVRRVGEGTIEVYFDDMKSPIMTATDKTFAFGRIGIGTFDDTGDFDDIKLYGVVKK